MPHDSVSSRFLERLTELFEGMPAGEPTWVTSGGPQGGLLPTVEALSAEQASTALGRTTIAAHVNHLVFAVGMVNRWAQGEGPEGDWPGSWKVQTVTEEEWELLKSRLQAEARELVAGPAARLDWQSPEMANYGFSTLAHTAYHLGAIRHMAIQLGAGSSVHPA